MLPMLSVVAGPDPFEPFSLQESGVGYLSPLGDASVARWRVAYSPDLGSPPIEPEVRDTVRDAVGAFDNELSANVQEVEIDLPDTLEHFINWWGPQLAIGYEDLAATGVVVEPDPLYRPLIEHTRRMSATDYARVQFEQRDRLHVGLQIAGPHGADAAVPRAARAFEQARPWAGLRPNL